jgi:excisionase family DNA binding protein
MTPAEIEQLAELLADRVAERMTASPSGDAWLDVHGVAKLLGCSVPKVERMTRSGEIPSTKFGRMRRFLRSSILGLQEGSKHG